MKPDAAIAATATVFVALTALSVAPAQAYKKVPTTGGAKGYVGVYDDYECETYDEFCAGWIMLSLPSRLRPVDQNNNASAQLRNSQGKRFALEFGDFSNWDGIRGPDWSLPNALPSGKYALKWKVSRKGQWNCSAYYYDVCRWVPGMKASGTSKFTFKQRPIKFNGEQWRISSSPTVVAPTRRTRLHVQSAAATSRAVSKTW